MKWYKRISNSRKYISGTVTSNTKRRLLLICSVTMHYLLFLHFRLFFFHSKHFVLRVPNSSLNVHATMPWLTVLYFDIIYIYLFECININIIYHRHHHYCHCYGVQFSRIRTLLLLLLLYPSNGGEAKPVNMRFASYTQI